jgi:hypothetical protein
MLCTKAVGNKHGNKSTSFQNIIACSAFKAPLGVAVFIF